MNPEDIPSSVLNQRWLHSHEEDTADETVFRPSTFWFPPSRGRTGFELRPDGSAAVVGIAPTDALQEHRGTWKIDATKQLVVDIPGLKETRIMPIVSSTPDRLVIKKKSR